MRTAMVVLVVMLLVMGGVAGPPHSEAADSCSLNGNYHLDGMGEAAGFLEVFGTLTFTPNGACTGGTVGGSVTRRRQGEAPLVFAPAGSYAVSAGGDVTLSVPGIIELVGKLSLDPGGGLPANALHLVAVFDAPQVLSVTATRNPPVGLGSALSWSQSLPAATRFQLVLGGAAVLDQETGLVWEQAPETAPNPTTTQTWVNALASCTNRAVGGRKGWRLPGIQELASLVDPTNPNGNPDLPPGHPFSNVQSAHYWSATTFAVQSYVAWDVAFSTGNLTTGAKTDTRNVWCVRGGQGGDPQ